MTQSMIALVKRARGPGEFGLEEVAVPEPGPGEVRVAVRSAGICGTDLHIAEGTFPATPPVVMGHEVAGIVDLLGEQVEQRWLGERVALETYARVCGKCRQCRSGRQNLCPARRSIGSHVNGGFASHIVVPAANLHRLEDRLSFAAGSLYEPLACVAHTLCDPAASSPGDNALVVGPGTVGLLAAQLLRAQGAAVTVAGTRTDLARLDMAGQLGLETVQAAELGSPSAPHFDLVADCSGSQEGTATALRQVRKGGVFALIGLSGHPITVDLDLVCLNELSVRSGFASTPQSWARVEALVGAGRVELEPLITASIPLARWGEAFERTKAAMCVKLVLDPVAEP